jgi:hypothetical protein
MTQADGVHSTPRRFTPKIVGGIDHLPDDRAQKQSTDAHDAHQPRTGSLSTTARNGRLRDQRHEAWRMAEAATRYWRARLDFHDALSWVQRSGMSEGRSHPAVNDEDRHPLVERWRAAFAKQLLTPAWDAASVAWKHLAFLAAHPVLQSNRRSAKAKDEAPAPVAS